MNEAFVDPVRSYAQKTLARLRQNRKDYMACDVGVVRRVQVYPELLDRTPNEIIYEYAAGETSWADALAELADWPFTYPEDAEPGNPLSVRTWGSWQDVQNAHQRELISTAQYWQLYWRINPRDDNDNKEAQ